MGNILGRETDIFETPWREIQPTDLPGDFGKLKDYYLKELTNFKPHGAVQFINILLLGQSASGKSSFINSCATALREGNRTLSVAGVLTPQNFSSTGRLIPPVLRLGDGRILPARLYDCRGLHDIDGVKSKDLEDMIGGYVKPGYLIDPKTPIDQDNGYYRPNPEIGDRMHVIVYVAAADNHPEQFTDNHVRDQLKDIRSDWTSKADLPQVVLLTRVDRLGLRDPKELFRDENVKRVCEHAVEGLGLPLNHVFPTINYYDKPYPDDFHDFLALHNLWQIINKGNDFVENNTDIGIPEGFRS